MAKLNWIDALFFGVRRILAAGVELPERPALNFVGASVTDNPAENRIDVVFQGSGLSRISPVVMSDYTASPGELVRVDAHSPVTITLPPAAGNALAEVVVKEFGGGGEVVTILAREGELMEGQPAVQLAGPRSSMHVMSDGVGWLVT